MKNGFSAIEIKNITPLPVCEKEVLRYAGANSVDDSVLSLLKDCINEVEGVLKYRAVYGIFDINEQNGVCDFGVFNVESDKLAANLKGCKKAVIFACTVGIELDRLIAKYVRISPSRALIIQAIGTERIEACCDALCMQLEKEYSAELRPRFSPGYGDVPLGVQKHIFDILGCRKNIGITLTDSMLMVPSKSVTAFAGILNAETNKDINKYNKNNNHNKCSECENTDCTFRRDL